jgi:hypothetical protein
MSTLDTPAGTIHVEQPWVLKVSVAACAAVGANVSATKADALSAPTAPTTARGRRTKPMLNVRTTVSLVGAESPATATLRLGEVPHSLNPLIAGNCQNIPPSPPSRNVATMDDLPGGYGTPGPREYQSVLNQAWPPSEAAVAQKDRPNGIDVQVRIVFETDGEQWVDGIARRWWERHVCVECEDPRLQVRYVWVDAADVRRR